MSNTSSNVQVGPGLFGLGIIVSIVLAVLKVAGVLAISWLTVALPALITGAITLALVAVAVIAFAIAALVVTKRR